MGFHSHNSFANLSEDLEDPQSSAPKKDNTKRLKQRRSSSISAALAAAQCTPFGGAPMPNPTEANIHQELSNLMIDENGDICIISDDSNDSNDSNDSLVLSSESDSDNSDDQPTNLPSHKRSSSYTPFPLPTPSPKTQQKSFFPKAATTKATSNGSFQFNIPKAATTKAVSTRKSSFLFDFTSPAETPATGLSASSPSTPLTLPYVDSKQATVKHLHNIARTSSLEDFEAKLMEWMASKQTISAMDQDILEQESAHILKLLDLDIS